MLTLNTTRFIIIVTGILKRCFGWQSRYVLALYLLLVCGLAAGFATANEGAADAITTKETIPRYVNAEQIVGSGRFEYLFWDVYDAFLYADGGQYDATKPFALELRYLRDLDGDEIAKRSLKEMQGQGLADELLAQQWLAQMLSIFPNVREGDRLLGVSDEQKITRFYYNEQLIGEVNDPAFSDWFFGIWLSENTSEPKFRKALLGLR